MPAYNLSGYYCITFLAFMILNLYLFNNILLATVYSNYKKHLKNEVKVSIKLRREKLKKAFDFLKTKSENYTEKFSITYGTFERLIKAMYPQNSESKTKILFNLLDRDEGNQICEQKIFYLILG
jgi:two pore calcium channel protein 3